MILVEILLEISFKKKSLETRDTVLKTVNLSDQSSGLLSCK